MMEEWRPIPEYPKYEVSSFGRVRRGGRILKAWKSNRGYPYMRLGKHAKNVYVHRLVARAFIGEIGDLQINHIDLDKTNNTVSNLEICTAKHNMRHAADAGLFSRKRA